MSKDLKFSDFFVHIRNIEPDHIKFMEWTEVKDIKICFPKTITTKEERIKYADKIVKSYFYQHYFNINELIENRSLILQNELNIFLEEDKNEGVQTDEDSINKFTELFYTNEIEYFKIINENQNYNAHVNATLSKYIEFCINKNNGLNNNENLELLIDKKSFLEKELITTYESEKKFALQEQIKELENKILEMKK